MKQSVHPLVDWLYGLRGPDLKWELDTAREFTAALGHPERRFPAIHVAGTNGKGSVAAMTEAIARAAGLRTGLFTSPHLVCPSERIRLDGRPIRLDRFVERIGALRALAAQALEDGRLGRHPSFFEMLTAAALAEFADHRVDLAILEVGLGGRLDATNVVVPAVTAITTIGLDHRKTLGGTIEAIAAEKAGVIKPGIPVVIGTLPAAARAVVEQAARRAGAPLFAACDEVRLALSAGDTGELLIETPEARYEPTRLGLAGAHQRANAAVAVRVVELLRARAGLAVPPHAIAAGLRQVDWPGRLERIDGRPPVLLDAAHNVDGVVALAAHLARSAPGARPPGRRVLVFGLTEGRDPSTMLAPLVEHVAVVVATAPDTSRAIDPALVAATARRHGRRAEIADDAAAALAMARRLAGPEGEIVGAGSLYLVGDLRRELLGLEGAGHPRRETVPPLAERQARRPARSC